MQTIVFSIIEASCHNNIPGGASLIPTLGCTLNRYGISGLCFSAISISSSSPPLHFLEWLSQFALLDCCVTAIGLLFHAIVHSMYIIWIESLWKRSCRHNCICTPSGDFGLISIPFSQVFKNSFRKQLTLLFVNSDIYPIVISRK